MVEWLVQSKEHMLTIFLLMLQMSWYNVESLSAFDEFVFNKTYDLARRPLSGDRPLEISVEMAISTLGPIDERDMTFHLSFHTRQRWNDPRLAYNSTTDNITSNVFPGDKIWIPDIYVENSRYVDYNYEFSRTVIKSNGDVYFTTQVAVSCTCFMELANYPMDIQTCAVVLQSYAFSIREVRLVWYDKLAPKLPSKHKLSLTGYDLKNIFKTETVFSYGEDDFNKHSTLMMNFQVQRTSIYFVHKAFLPTMFLSLFNMGSYFIPDDAMPARVTLIITTFLANTYILQKVTAETIKVSYTTALQIFLLMNLLFMAVSIIQYLLLLALKKREVEKKLDVIEKQKMTSKTSRDVDCNVNGSQNKTKCNNHKGQQKEHSFDNYIWQKEFANSNHLHPETMARFTFLEDSNKHEVHMLDRTFRILMPSIYALFCAVYFGYYLS